jgi:DNA-binding transcriptional LysR family regulator
VTIRLDQWRGVEVRHLVTLSAIAEEGSFRRAAQRLGYSQAAVSAQMATLERLLGTRLLNRPRGRGSVTLTDAGQVALAHAEAIVARLTATEADIAATQACETVRVGVFQSVGARVLPELVARLGKQLPAVNLEVVERASDGDLLELVATGELDLAFAMLPLPDGPFRSVEIAREPFVLLAPRQSPLANRRSVVLADLAGIPLVAGRSCRATAAAEDAARAEVGPLQVAFRSDDNETIRALVTAGLGVSLVPRLLVDERDERLIAVHVEGLPPRRIALTWHADRRPTEPFEVIVELSQQVAGASDRGIVGWHHHRTSRRCIGQAT